MDSLCSEFRKNLSYKVALLTVIFPVVYFAFYWFCIKEIAVWFCVGYTSYCIYVCICNLMPREKLDDLHKKAVLITGCDSGFGYETAKSLDRIGVKVFAGCLFPDKEGAKQLKKNSSNRLQILKLDVTSNEDIQNCIKTVESSIGSRKLKAVINNAGITLPSPVEWIPIESFQKVFEVNTLGTIRTTKLFLPLLRKSKGRVVIVASFAGRVLPNLMSSYGVSKAGALSYADALRRELCHWPISVHSVEPGFYKTPMSNFEAMKNVVQKYYKELPSDVQNSYGEKFLNSTKCQIDNLERYMKPESKVYEVVDDIVDAAVGLYPKIRYFPGMGSEFLFSHIMHFPPAIIDYFFNFISPINKSSFLRK